MAKSLQEILGYQAMLGVVEKVKRGLPSDFLPPAFLASNQVTDGNTGSYLKIEGNRQTARLVQYGSPSVKRAQKGVSKQAVSLLHTFEQVQHSPLVLDMLQSMDSPQRQAMGQQEVNRQTAAFMSLFQNLRLNAVLSAITKGAIWFDSDGNMLASSSGASYTVDFGVPAGNKAQLNVLGAGNIIAASWATAATDILSQLRNLKAASAQLSGYVPQVALCGAKIHGYVAANTIVGNLLKTDANLATAIRSGGSFTLAGIEFIPAETAFFVDANGTSTSWLGDDEIAFMPQPDPTWYDLLEGTYVVPTDLGAVAQDANGAMSNLERVRGMFQYAKISHDPVGVQHYAGDTFLPVVKVPKALFLADVTP